MNQNANYNMNNVKGYQSTSFGSRDYITNNEIKYNSNKVNIYDDVEEIDYSVVVHNDLTTDGIRDEKIRENQSQSIIYRNEIARLTSMITFFSNELNNLENDNEVNEDLHNNLFFLSPYSLGLSNNFPACLLDIEIADRFSEWAYSRTDNEFYQVIELLEYFGYDDFYECIEPEDYVNHFMENVQNGVYREIMFSTTNNSLDMYISDNFIKIFSKLCNSYIVNGNITFDLDVYADGQPFYSIPDSLRIKIQNAYAFNGAAETLDDIRDCLSIICSNQNEADFYLEQINNLSIGYDDVKKLEKYVDDLKLVAMSKMIEKQFGDVFNAQYNVGYSFLFNSLEGPQSLNSLTQNYLDELHKLDKKFIDKSNPEYIEYKSTLESEYMTAMHNIIRSFCNETFDDNNLDKLSNDTLLNLGVSLPNYDNLKECFYFSLNNKLVSEISNTNALIQNYQNVLNDFIKLRDEKELLLKYTSNKDFKNYYTNEKYLKDLNEEILNIMTPAEKRVYSYLLEKHGASAAKEYYELKLDDFNKRAGLVRAAEFLDKLIDDNGHLKEFSEMTEEEISSLDALLYELGFEDHLSLIEKGLIDGIDAFWENLMNTFSADGVKSIHEYETIFITTFLATDLSASLSYGVSSTIGNMAVPLAISACASMAGSAGFALTSSFLKMMSIYYFGGSAMGSAYEQGLQMGFTDFQASLYGILCGASEFVLESFLGGIPGFSMIEQIPGFKGYFLNMFKEGFEESTQCILESFLAYIATGEYQSVDPNEVVKSGFYGMLTGGIINGIYAGVEFVPEAVEIIKQAYEDGGKMGIVAPGFVPAEAFQSVETAKEYVNQFMENSTGADVVGYTLSEFKSMIEAGGLDNSILSELNKLSVSDKLKLAWELDGYAGWIGFTDIRGMTFFVENGFLKAKINWPAYGGMKLSTATSLRNLLNGLGIDGIEIKGGVIRLDRIGGKGGGTYALLTDPIYSTSQRSILNDMNNPNNAYRQMTLDINKYKTFCDGAFDIVEYVTKNNISIETLKKEGVEFLDNNLRLKQKIYDLGRNLGLDMDFEMDVDMNGDMYVDMNKQKNKDVLENWTKVISAIFGDKSYYADMQPGNRPDILDIHNQGIDSQYGYVGEAAEWLSDTGEKITDGGAVQFNLRSSEAALENLGIIEYINGGE